MCKNIFFPILGPISNRLKINQPFEVSILDLEGQNHNEKAGYGAQNDGLGETVILRPIAAFFVRILYNNTKKTN